MMASRRSKMARVESQLGHAAMVAASSLAAVAGCGSARRPPATPPPAAEFPAPWQRAEVREPCASFDPLRAPFFGDLHVHTKYSADASISGPRSGRRTRRLRQGRVIQVSDADENRHAHGADGSPARFHRSNRSRRVVRRGAAVPDQQAPCRTMTTSASCCAGRMTRRISSRDGPVALSPPASPPRRRRLPFCSDPGVDCGSAAVSVWQEMQAAAEADYDRSAACTFTSFIGYEHTPSPAGGISTAT